MTANATPSIEQLYQDRDVEGLIAALDSSQPATRQAAIEALGALGDARAVPALLALRADPYERNQNINQAAEAAIVRIGRPAVPAVLDALKLEVEVIAAAAIVDAKNSKIKTMSFISYLEHEARETAFAVRILGRIGEAAVHPLLEMLRHDSDALHYPFITEALVRAGPAATEALSSALGDPNPVVTEVAIDALIGIGAPLVVQPLLADLNDPHRCDAARDLLAQLGPLAVRPLLILCARMGEPSEVCLEAIWELGSGARRPLFYALGDPNPAVVRVAARALAAAEIPLLDLLAEALSDPAKRTGARYALELVNTPEAAAILAEHRAAAEAD